MKDKDFKSISSSFCSIGRLGFLGTMVLVMMLPILFIVATIGSVFTMLFSKKRS